MTTDQDRRNDALEILGFALDDESKDAETARVWIDGTLDLDENWFERRSIPTIKAAYYRWLTEAYGEDRP